MVIIEDWMKSIPGIKNGKNKLKVYAYLYYFYKNDLTIHPSLMNIAEVCEIPQPRASEAVKALQNSNVLSYKSGSFNFNHKRANVYVLNEDYIPIDLRVKKEASQNNPNLDYDLVGYINNNNSIPNDVKEALVNWIHVTQTNDCTVQLRLKLIDLQEWSRNDDKSINWEKFKAKVERSTQRKWYSFIYESDIKEKESKSNQFKNHKTYQL